MNLLARFLVWLLKIVDKDVTVSKIDRFTANQILKSIRKYEHLGPDVDGEWKAHNVYSAMQKEFPVVPKCDIRYQMEIIFQRYERDRKSRARKTREENGARTN